MANTELAIQDIYPLTPMQSGMLLHHQYAPKSDAYFIQGIYNIEGSINAEKLSIAWKQAIIAHTILRTGFFWKDGKPPFQFVLDKVNVNIVNIDLSKLDASTQEQKIEAYLQEDRTKRFNFNKPPLFRLILIRTGTNKHLLIWSHHHILLDGWCVPIVIGDVLKAYEAIVKGEKVQLTHRRPFRDYIAWLQKQDMAKAEAFWRQNLLGIEEPTRISFKGLFEPDNEKDYRSLLTTLSEEDTTRLRRFAQENNLTLNTLMQAAVGFVLKTYSRQEEVILGVTVSGRNIDLQGIEKMVGLFINSLPLRMTFKPGESIFTFLERLQQTTQRLNEYAYAPLAQIQTWSGHNQGLFDALFVFENYPLEESDEASPSGLKIKGITGVEKTEYPLTIAVGPEREIQINHSYQTEHFNEELIERLAGHIKQVLQGMINASEKASVDELPLMTDKEQNKLLIEWNDTKVDYPIDKTLHQLFEEQVDKTPDNVAVIFEDQQLTYRQVNEKANQLAYYLRDQGVTPDTPVAIAVDRSPDMVIGLLGILKAGGAYVPLDPSYPQERLSYMLEDSNPTMLLTQSSLEVSFKDFTGTTIALDKIWEAIGSCPTTNPASINSPYDLAYVIYTSGSTGKPKGVENSHQAIQNRLQWTLEAYPISKEDSSLYIASVGFDISVWEMIFPLSAGARLVIASDEQNKDIHAIAQLVQQHEITTLHFVPSLLNLFINSPEAEQCKSIKQIITGGELLPNDLRLEFLEKFKDTQLYLAYGPTEAAISVTHWNCRTDNYLDKTPIGQPISNSQIYILDDRMNPVPVGASGEIYIGGVVLARGYLNRPDLTAERFVPNPYAPDTKLESLRLYRTGDLARYLPDGNIEFLGRSDNQVKIRGFRIELGEIESTLLLHNYVSQVIVTTRENEPGHKQLVAYIVPESSIIKGLEVQDTLASTSQNYFSVLTGASIPSLATDLRNHLARSLPDYMVPPFFIFLDQIPLTVNGKIDWQNLIFTKNLLNIKKSLAPSTNLENLILKIWRKILNLRAIDIDTNFFDLGGNSLLAISVNNELKSKYCLDIALEDLFIHTTIRKLASHINRKQKNEKQNGKIYKLF